MSQKMMALVCEECGKTVMIPAARTTQKVCRDCNIVRNNRRSKERDARLREERAKRAPKMFTCPMCGEVTERKTTNKKYCTECAAKRLKMTAAQRQQLDMLLGISKVKRPTKSEEFTTFDTAGKSIERLNAEARAFGMNYGRYVAACHSGSIHQILKAEGVKEPEQILREIPIT